MPTTETKTKAKSKAKTKAIPSKKPTKPKSKPRAKKTTKTTTPTPTIVPKKRFSFWNLFSLFLGAILLGTVLFSVTHSADQYHFQNPLTTLKRILIAKISRTPSYSLNYASYEQLSKNISLNNKDNIEAFLDQYPNSSLAMSLRNKWLLLLAGEKDWNNFIEDYRPTNNQEVECYYLRALYQTGKENLALSGVKRLWRAGYKPISACRAIFLEWQKSPNFKEKYLWQRLQLAVDQNDSASIQELTAMLPIQKQALVKMWLILRKNPSLLAQTSLPDNAQGQRIAMDVFKAWVALDTKKAIAYWPKLQKQYHFSRARTQDFYRTASLHLVLLGDPDAENWFAKILPAYSTSQSRAWQVRFALIHQKWKTVLSIIQSMPEEEKQSNIWQYWEARALEKTGNTTEAHSLYQKLANQRQYYGFLAAYQLHQALSIKQEDFPNRSDLLKAYTEQIDQIKALYESNQIPKALQLTQDLLQQLNPEGEYALAKLFYEWGWFAESMNIVNRSTYQDDLKLRFPMPHEAFIRDLCNKANIPPALVFSIARQESNFHKDVFSSAGGLGMLQLTLSTARQFAPNITEKELYNPETNITVSITYLKKLMQQFNSHPLLVVSAYNAGPTKTRRWQPENVPMPADIWIETRPWEETRNYLKNITAYYAVYQYLLRETPHIDGFMKDIPSR